MAEKSSLFEGCTHPRTHAHGDYLTYRVHHCRCALCRSAWSKRTKLDVYQRHVTGGRHLVDVPADVVDILQHLRELGITTRDIGEHAGVGETTIRRLLSNSVARVPQATVTTVRRLHVSDFHTRIGATRRVQALAVAGFSITWVAHYTKLSKKTVAAIQAGSHEGHTSGYDRIAALFERVDVRNPVRLGMDHDQMTRVQHHAREAGWIPAMAWNDNTIDDPDADPDGVRLSEPTARSAEI